MFGDLAVFAAKEYFGGYVDRSASFEQCMVFLNGRGVSISLFDLMDPAQVVKKEDFARIAGQSKLLFLGEAEYKSGTIRKPLDAETWVDYCLLNDVDIEPLWKSFVEKTAEGSLPEVKVYFNR